MFWVDAGFARNDDEYWVVPVVENDVEYLKTVISNPASWILNDDQMCGMRNPVIFILLITGVRFLATPLLADVLG
jgi:hypothetical protein